MTWLALAVGLGVAWWLTALRLRMWRARNQSDKDRVSAAWIRDNSYDRRGY